LAAYVFRAAITVSNGIADMAEKIFCSPLNLFIMPFASFPRVKQKSRYLFLP
jgi:hypothetical protein